MGKRGIKALAITALIFLVSTMVLPVVSVKAEPGKVTRTSGANRYATAAEVAMANWTTSENIVLVTGEGYADAVSASVLAKKLDAPILLTRSETLNEYAQSALNTLKPKNIYIIGGTGAIPQTVRDQLKANYKLVELGGATRYETNIAVAKELVSLGVDPSKLLLVGGQGFSDALSAAPIAAAKGQILLLGNNDADSMKSVIQFIKDNNSKVTVIGTENVISAGMFSALGADNRVQGGTDRFDTNLKVLAAFKDSVKTDKLYIATAVGDGYADALVASALAGKYAAPLILTSTDGSEATTNAVNYIKANANKSTDLNVIGGTGVVSDTIVDSINKAVSNGEFSGTITSVEALYNQSVNVKANDQALPFTVNGGQSVSISDLVSAGYSIKFVTDSPVFSYDSNTSKSQWSTDGTLDKTAVTYFYYGSTTNTNNIANDHFKYQVQIYKNGSMVALSDFTSVDIINGDTTASNITGYTIRLLSKDVNDNYVSINAGDRDAATQGSNLSAKITSGKLVKGEEASVSEVKGSLISGGTNLVITNVKFYSSNPFIASVDEDSGVITANNTGDFTLTISSGNQIKDVNMSVVSDIRKVSSASANISSIKIGKNASTTFYLRLMDQYGDPIQGKAVVPTASSVSIMNGSTTKDTDYQVQYVKNSNGNAIAYEKVVTQADTEGKAVIQVLNDTNTPNIGDGTLKIVNNSGATMLILPVTVNTSALVSSIRLEPVKDGKSEALTLDLNPQAASDNNNEYVKINLNKYAIDGTSLDTVNSNSSDFGKYRFYITQDPSNKIVDDSAAADKTLIPVNMNPDGNIIITTPYGIVDQGFMGWMASTITPSNNIQGKVNVINTASTGTVTLIAKSYDPITNTEGLINSMIKITVRDSSPVISSIQFENNIEASIPSTSSGGDIVKLNIRDILKETNICVNGYAGDGKVRIADNGAIFINYKDNIQGAISNIQSGDPAYDPAADILLGYIVAAPSDSNISYTTVNDDGTITAKLALGKTSGKFTIGVRRIHENTPFITTVANINRN